MTISSAELAAIWGQTGLSLGPGIAQTLDRRYAASSYSPGTGVLQMSGIWLPAGISITSIILFTVGAVNTNTHNWAALYKNDLTLMAQSTDDTTSGDFGANTKVTKALTSVQVTPYTGLYYIGWMQTVSTTMNSMLAALTTAASLVNADAPVLSGTSTTGLTTTAPSPAAAISATVNNLYAYVN